MELNKEEYNNYQFESKAVRMIMIKVVAIVIIGYFVLDGILQTVVRYAKNRQTLKQTLKIVGLGLLFFAMLAYYIFLLPL